MKSKLILVSALLSVYLQSCSNTTSDVKETEAYVIEGFVQKTYEKISLSKVVDGELIVVDSVINANSAFKFSGFVEAPEMYYLKLTEELTVPIFIENSTISVEVEGNSLDSINISGSGVHEEWESIINEIDSYDIKLDEIAKQYYEAEDEGNEEMRKYHESRYDSLDAEKSDFILNTVESNPTSYVSPYLVHRFLSFSSEINDLENLRNGFDPSIKNSVYVAAIDERIQILEKTKIGGNIPEFSLPDTSGTLVSVKDFEGQYVLIDFWASWCGPCRKENPNVVSAFQRFKSEGFTVLGISLDNSKEAWVKAIKDDRLSWTHLSDLEGWKNSVAVDFGVRSIPFSILIDPSGIIIAKNLREEELHDTLEKYLKNDRKE